MSNGSALSFPVAICWMDFLFCFLDCSVVYLLYCHWWKNQGMVIWLLGLKSWLWCSWTLVYYYGLQCWWDKVRHRNCYIEFNSCWRVTISEHLDSSSVSHILTVHLILFLAGSSLVVLVKKAILTWLSGMKLKGLLRGHTMASENVRSVLFNSTQPETASWPLEMNFLLNYGTWIAPTY